MIFHVSAFARKHLWVNRVLATSHAEFAAYCCCISSGASSHSFLVVVLLLLMASLQLTCLFGSERDVRSEVTRGDGHRARPSEDDWN